MGMAHSSAFSERDFVRRMRGLEEVGRGNRDRLHILAWVCIWSFSALVDE